MVTVQCFDCHNNNFNIHLKNLEIFSVNTVHAQKAKKM